MADVVLLSSQQRRRQVRVGTLFGGQAASVGSLENRNMSWQLMSAIDEQNNESHLLVHNAGVDSAKPKCVAKDVVDFFFARLVWHHVQITDRIGSLVIQSGRN
jgi:hypothetical protein